MINDSYLNETITDFFNIVVNNCIVVTGNKNLEKDIFKNIISIQYQAQNKTVFIETETYNYVLVESYNQLRLCEFYKKDDLEQKIKVGT